MDQINGYVDRISKLANRNKELQSQFTELVDKYRSIQQQDTNYHTLLKKFSTESVEKDIRLSSKALRRFKMVSLLYVHVRGFENLKNHTQAQDLIDELDEKYFHLSLIERKYNLMNVKLVGDAFLFAGGVLEENQTNPIDVVMAAIEIQRVFSASSILADENFWKVSIGIHTGPVFAEPTTSKQRPFRLNGESVNIAARLGMGAEESQTCISIMTYELTKEFFTAQHDGRLPVKYKGFLESYYVDGIHKELSVDGLGEMPNEKFQLKYANIQFFDIQEAFLDDLEKKLPESLYYHNIKHTIDVITEVELIGWAEGLTDEEILLLKLSALFHDSGHSVCYKGHEYEGTVIAREYLKKYSYTKSQVDTICRLIMATRYPPMPTDKLEQVICDSDLDYLGRGDFIPVSNNLYRELKEREMIGSFDEWNQMQLGFIRNHQYFTNTAIRMREVNKTSQIERLENLMREKINY